MFDNVKNAADDVPVIGTGDTVRAGKEADPFHLAFGKVKQELIGMLVPEILMKNRVNSALTC